MGLLAESTAEKPIILYVGAILAEKRVDAVIDAIQHIGPERASRDRGW